MQCGIHDTKRRNEDNRYNEGSHREDGVTDECYGDRRDDNQRADRDEGQRKRDLADDVLTPRSLEQSPRLFDRIGDPFLFKYKNRDDEEGDKAP